MKSCESETRKEQFVFTLTANEVQAYAQVEFGYVLRPEELEAVVKTLANSLKTHLPICIRVSRDTREIIDRK